MPNVGNPIPLTLQLFDGNTAQFVQATIRDNTGAAVGSPVSVPVVAGGLGLYQAQGPAMPDMPSVAVQYKVYSDSLFTTPSPTYADALEVQERTFTDDQIAADVWLQTQVSSHVSGTFGAALQGIISASRANNLDNLNAAISTIVGLLGTPATSSMSGDIAAIAAKTSQFTFTSGNVNANAQAVSDKTGYSLSSPGVTAIAQGIWNSLTASYTNAGSFGLLLGTASAIVAPSSITAIVAGVWNAMASSFLESGSMGAIMSGLSTNVSVNLNTIASQASVNALATTVAGLATQSTVSSLFPILGTPANGSLAADIAQVEAGTATLVSRLTSIRAGNLDNLNINLSTLATQAAVNTIIGLIGTPAVTVSADIASIKSNTSELATNYTAGRAANLDFLDVAISTRASQSLLSDIYALLGTPITTLSGDVAALATTVDALPSAAEVWTYSTRSLNTDVNAIVDLSALATASQLTAAQAAILAAINAFQVRSTASIDPATDILTVLVWLTLEGMLVSNPTSATAQIYNAAGALVLDLGSLTSYTPGGIFEFQAGSASASLPANQSYTIRTTVTQTPNTFTGTKAFTTFT